MTSDIDQTRPIELFKLFFTERWLEKIVQYTNINAIRIQDEEATGETPHQRYWHPVTKYELYAYFAGVIHMGIHKEAQIEDYWRDYTSFGVQHRIRDFIGAKRWEQIDRFLYLETPRENMVNTFERVWDFSEHFQRIPC